jgi:Tfp pilus assembly protein PilF
MQRAKSICGAPPPLLIAAVLALYPTAALADKMQDAFFQSRRPVTADKQCLGNVADLDRVIKQKPDYIEAYIMRGIALHKQGHNQIAITDFTKALTLDSGNKRQLSAKSYLGRGICYRALGLDQKAINDFGQSISLDPDLSLAYRERAVLYSKQGKRTLAERDYEKALDLWM